MKYGIPLVCALAVAVGGACLRAHAEDVPLEKSLAAPGKLPAGWKCSGDVVSYDAKKLFELIDGEAELYFPYGFKRALAATYAAPSGDETVAVEVYELGSLLDAFGAYSNYRDGSKKLIEIGAEGFMGSTQILFYQDRFFVKLRLAGKVLTNQDALIDCAKTVSRLLPKGRSKPEELRLLNVPTVLPQTAQYFAQSLLGYDFFATGLTAEAAWGTESVRVFVVIEITSKTAKETLTRYQEYLLSEKATYYYKDMPFGKVLCAKDPLHKGVVAKQAGNCIVGVAKLPEPEQGMALLEELSNAALKQRK